MATLYKVQSGAFKSAVRAAAAAVLAKKKIEKYLEKEGIKEKVGVAVIHSDGYYKVQEGAFASKENAHKRRDLVRASGTYATVIETKTQDPVPAVPASPAVPAAPADPATPPDAPAPEKFHPRIRVMPICFFEKNEALYGDCTAIIEYDTDGKTVAHCALIDCATGSASPVIVKKLQQEGVKKIDAVFLSHAHGDHYGGFTNIKNVFPVDAVYLPDCTELDRYQKTYGDALRRQAKKVKKSRFLKAGDSVRIGHVLFKNIFICPASKLKEHDNHHFVNNVSMALRITLDEKWIFISAGDLQNEGNKILLSTLKAKDLKCHIYKLQWHGDRNAILTALMQVMRPLIAFSNYHHRERSGRGGTRKVAESVGATVARNWENGHIYIDCQGDAMTLSCSKGNIFKRFKL